MKHLILALLTMSSIQASADQCAWNTPTDAISARDLVNLHKEVIFFCENCGETNPGNITKIVEVRIPRIDDKYNIGGGKKFRYVILTYVGKTGELKDIEADLAYTYARTASDIFTNLAQAVGCPSTGASTFIQTTNQGGKKIPHYYDATGTRQPAGMPSFPPPGSPDASTGAGETQRKPASYDYPIAF